jgi:hypothetical protein
MPALRFDTGRHLDAGWRLDTLLPPVVSPPKTKKYRMTNLQTFFINPFLATEVTFSRLLKYSARHLARMIANNPGSLLDARITDTTTALNAAENTVTDVATKQAIQEARTQIKNDFREALPAHIRRVHGAVAGAFGDPSPEMTECFPQGRRVYSECKDEELNNKLGQLVACLTPKSAQVGATIVTLATNLKTQWQSIFSQQDQAMSDREVTAEGRDTARTELAEELFLNLLLLVETYPNDLAKCDYYCPQQYLRRPAPRTVPEDATLTADPFNPATRKVTLHASADGAETIRFERRMQGETDWSEVAVVTADEGSADFEDTLANDGSFEYRAIGLHGTTEGGPSAVLVVVAA